MWVFTRENNGLRVYCSRILLYLRGFTRNATKNIDNNGEIFIRDRQWTEVSIVILFENWYLSELEFLFNFIFIEFEANRYFRFLLEYRF